MKDENANQHTGNNIKQTIIYKVRHLVDLKNKKKYLNRRRFDRIRETYVIYAFYVYILYIPGVSR